MPAARMVKVPRAAATKVAKTSGAAEATAQRVAAIGAPAMVAAWAASPAGPGLAVEAASSTEAA
ncbi:hypothetical protein ASD01_10690 [Ensifer sp. Root423]|nr:hypothetical protein ASD01_10690 [Ensifer sp. Root423]